MLRYAFSALLGVFLSLNKGSKLLSCIATKLKSPTVRYGWVGLFYVCENPPTLYEHHTGWAWLSPGEHRCVLIFPSKSFPSMAAETLTTSRNYNAVETRLVFTPFGSYRCIRLELDLDGLKILVDSSTGSSIQKEILLERVRQEQNRIKLQDVSVDFTPTNAESSIFFWSEVYGPGRSWAWSWSCSISLEDISRFPIDRLVRAQCAPLPCGFQLALLKDLSASVYFYVCIFVRISFQLVVH